MTDSKNRPVFSLTEEQITELLQKNTEAADLISAFMVLACHTDRTGIYSTAGAKAVRNRLHVGTNRAEALLMRLANKRLITSAENLTSGKLKEEMPQREGRAAVRWIITPDKSRRIWLPAEIVRGIATWKSPLLTLRQCGNDAARLLLALYLFEDPVQYGGIDPTRAVYTKYEIEELHKGYPIGERTLFSCAKDHSYTWTNFPRELLGFKTDKEGYVPEFWKALDRLTDHGFIYERLTIFSRTKITSEMCMLYPLHTFNRHGHPPKGEESLSGKMHSVASAVGKSLADAGGYFTFRRFAFLADDDNVQAVGIYLLRFRNTRPDFEDVLIGWQALQDSRRRWEDTADHLLETIAATAERIKNMGG
jgi:hypothetical protein